MFNKYNIEIEEHNLLPGILQINEKSFYQELFKYLNLVFQIRNSKVREETDYMLSPVKNANGKFFDTRDYDNKSALPCNADANGAYNIARKGLWVMEQIRKEEGSKINLSISNKEWLEYAQNNKNLG